VETDLQAALDWGPDAVIVSNPTALHLQVAIPAARAGCALLLEKPISHSLEGIDELRQAVARSGSRALVGFQFRYNPGLRTIRALLAEEAIGRPAAVRAHWGEYLPGWHPWEDSRSSYSARADLGGGVVLTLCHPLDYLRSLLGEISALWAFTGQLSELELSGVEDTAEIGLRFASGALGSIHLDYLQSPPTHRLEVIGSRGALAWDNASGEVRLLDAASQQAEIIPAPPGFERNTMFLAQMEHFLRVLRGEDRPECSLEDGIRALELALAVHQSARSGSLVRWSD
jgi:predicted dehydrogenase